MLTGEQLKTKYSLVMNYHGNRKEKTNRGELCLSFLDTQKSYSYRFANYKIS